MTGEFIMVFFLATLSTAGMGWMLWQLRPTGYEISDKDFEAHMKWLGREEGGRPYSPEEE